MARAGALCVVLSSRVHVPVLWFKYPAFSLNRTPWQSQSWGCPHSWCAESPPKVLEHPGRDLQSQSPSGPSASCIADTAALAACEEQSSAPSFSSYIKGLKFNMNFKRGRTGWSKAAGPGPGAEQRYLGTCPSSAEQQHCGTWRIIQPHPKCPGIMGSTGIPQMALLSHGFTELCSPWVTVVHMARGDSIPQGQTLPCTFISLLASRQPLEIHHPQAQHHPPALVPAATLPVPYQQPRRHHISSCLAPHVSFHARGLERAGEQRCAGGAGPTFGGQLRHPHHPHPQNPLGCCCPISAARAEGCAGSRNKPGLGKHHLPPTQPPTAPRPLRSPRRAGALGEGAAAAGWGLSPRNGQGTGQGSGYGLSSRRSKSRPGTGSCRRNGAGLRGQGCPISSPPWGTGEETGEDFGSFIFNPGQEQEECRHEV